jgi:hypothetical protein
VVLDSRPENPVVESIAHFALVLPVEFSSQKGGDIVGFDRMNGGMHDGVIDELQVVWLFKCDVGRILHLHNASAIHQTKLLGCRAVAIRQNV